jgi:hypothetical protein
MADGDGWTSQLITNLAQYLHDHSVGVWRPAGSYTAGEIAICDRIIPPFPDRLITLAAYPITTPPQLQDVTVGVQARIRGTTDTRVCDDIGDALFELLDGAKHLVLGDIRTVQIYRQSAGSLGHDSNERWEASHNYYVEAMRSTLSRTR